jgi:hypothetical protein
MQRIPLTTMAAATILPGAIVTLLLTSNALVTWPSGQLGYGATSLGATLHSVVESSLYRPNRYFVNPFLLPAFQRLEPLLLPILGLALAGYLFYLAKRRMIPNVLAGAVLLATLLLHWIAFKTLGILLPLERTALFIPFLATLFVISVASRAPVSKTGAILHRMLLGTILLTALYFVSCVRLTYFKEWEWDADVREAYLAARAHRSTNGKPVVSSWYYTASLNFYRRMYLDQPMPEIASGDPLPEADIYVLHWVFDAETIEKRHLKVLFKGQSTDVVVVAAPRDP